MVRRRVGERECGRYVAEVERLELVAAVSPVLVLALDAIVERVGVGLGFVGVYLSVGRASIHGPARRAGLVAGVPAALHEEDHDAEHDRGAATPTRSTRMPRNISLGSTRMDSKNERPSAVPDEVDARTPCPSAG